MPEIIVVAENEDANKLFNYLLTYKAIIRKPTLSEVSVEADNVTISVSPPDEVELQPAKIKK